MAGKTVSMTVRPLREWRGEFAGKAGRKRSPFATITWIPTWNLLVDELWQVRAQRTVLFLDFQSTRDMRFDGFPKADARMATPAVALSFTHPRHGVLTFACNTFPNWQDNVRAVALTLEALRKVDRYETTPHAEQYAGFKALPAPAAPTGARGMSPADAAAILAEHHEFLTADELLDDPKRAEAAFRSARNKTHPDTNGNNGNPDGADAWHRAEDAKRVLDAHHAAAGAV